MSEVLLEALMLLVTELAKHGPEITAMVIDDMKLFQAGDLSADELQARWTKSAADIKAAAAAFQAATAPGT